ncbi:MAG: FAD-binding oxidoreductase [Rhodanobacteraceae bacterium]
MHSRQPPVRGLAFADTELASFDGQFRARCQLQRPDRYRLIEALPADRPRIARGSGVSYVGASFGNDAIVQDLGAFDRLLAFDTENGLLTVEAGAHIGDVQRFALSHGWYLPITPGHPAATIGGCIAADVHGKNPARDGTFRQQIKSMELWRAGADSVMTHANENSDLFLATCAGFGLTGTIVKATLRLAPIPTGLMLRRVPVSNLLEAARVLREAANAPVLYGWHDGRPDRFGRGVIRIGLATGERDARPVRIARADNDLPARIRPLSFALWNRVGIALANTWLGLRWCRAGQSPLALSDALFPLNRARTYFAGFGQAGFAEAQWLLPHARFDEFATALSDCIARLRPRIALISSKLFAGTDKATAFTFDGAGIALAIHVPAPVQTSQRAFLEALTELAIAHDGRPNLIKDSTLDATSVRSAIPEFSAARARLADANPGGLHTSELARRLGL